MARRKGRGNPAAPRCAAEPRSTLTAWVQYPSVAAPSQGGWPGSGWRDSNPHGLAPHTLSTCCVCLFRHTRTVLRQSADTGRQRRDAAACNAAGRTQSSDDECLDQDRFDAASGRDRASRPGARGCRRTHTAYWLRAAAETRWSRPTACLQGHGPLARVPEPGAYVERDLSFRHVLTTCRFGRQVYRTRRKSPPLVPARDKFRSRNSLQRPAAPSSPG